MIIAVDFDGTCVTHEYPNVGESVGAERVLKLLVNKGHQLILWTMRSGSTLDDAIKWFADNKIPLYGVNKNPTQFRWTESPKAYAHMYIDDAAFGVPLCGNPSGRPYVDWQEIERTLENDFRI